MLIKDSSGGERTIEPTLTSVPDSWFMLYAVLAELVQATDRGDTDACEAAIERARALLAAIDEGR